MIVIIRFPLYHCLCHWKAIWQRGSRSWLDRHLRSRWSQHHLKSGPLILAMIRVGEGGTTPGALAKGGWCAQDRFSLTWRISFTDVACKIMCAAVTPNTLTETIFYNPLSSPLGARCFVLYGTGALVCRPQQEFNGHHSAAHEHLKHLRQSLAI